MYGISEGTAGVEVEITGDGALMIAMTHWILFAIILLIFSFMWFLHEYSASRRDVKKSKKHSSYCGFLNVDGLELFISEDHYQRFISNLNLSKDESKDLTSDLRKENYAAISNYYRKRFDSMNKFDIDAARSMYFCDDAAKNILLEFLFKFMVSRDGWYMELVDDDNPLAKMGHAFFDKKEIDRSQIFRLCYCKHGERGYCLDIDMNRIIRLTGYPEAWTLVFDNDVAYHVSNEEIHIRNSPSFTDLLLQRANALQDSEKSSLSESMIGDNWHAKGRVIITIGVIIAGALLAFIMK